MICDDATGRSFAWIDDEAREDEQDVRDHHQGTHVIVHADHRIGLDNQAPAQRLAFTDRTLA